MATEKTETKAKATTAKSTARKTSAAKTVKAEAVQPTKPEPVKQESFELDSDEYVVVRNGFQGKLVYVSPRSGEVYVWDEFGDEQEMTVRELKNAKSSKKDFFINNWFMFNDERIPEALGVGLYYKNAISVDNFDEIFEGSVAEVTKKIEELPEGQKASVGVRAKELIQTGKIDSKRIIQAVEDILNVKIDD